MVYSLEERIEIVILYGVAGRNYVRTANLFNETHPGKDISDVQVKQLLTTFFEPRSVANRKRTTNNGARDEGLQVAVLGHINMDPCLSVRKLSEVSGVTRSTCHRILKNHRFHPFKIYLNQELNEDDLDRRLEFCESMTNKIRNNRTLLRSICFSDESAFFLNGLVNRHNCRYWSDVNPHVFREEHTQHPQKINVWAGIFNSQIVGPLFYQDNLNGQKYLDMLENTIDPLITEIYENNPEGIREEDIFYLITQFKLGLT